MKFYMTVRESDRGKVVAVCEKELLNKVFEEDDKILDLRGEFFYQEGLTKEVGIEEIVREINDAFTSNIVGNNVVEMLIEKEIIKRGNVREIKGIKYAMTFKI